MMLFWVGSLSENHLEEFLKLYVIPVSGSDVLSRRQAETQWTMSLPALTLYCPMLSSRLAFFLASVMLKSQKLNFFSPKQQVF